MTDQQSNTGQQIRSVPDFDAAALQLARHLIERFEGCSVGHVAAITARAMEIITSRARMSPETIILPERG